MEVEEKGSVTLGLRATNLEVGICQQPGETQFGIGFMMTAREVNVSVGITFTTEEAKAVANKMLAYIAEAEEDNKNGVL